MSATKAKTISAAEAAKLLGVELERVYRLLRSGKLEGEKDGDVWRVAVAAVEARRARLRAKAQRPTILERLRDAD